MDDNIINISVYDIFVDAELGPSATAVKIIEALPFNSAVNTWGDEIHFNAPAQIKKPFTSLRAFSKLRERSDCAFGPNMCIGIILTFNFRQLNQ